MKNKLDKALQDLDKCQYELEKARKYIDIAEVMLILLDKDGKVRMINKKGAKILGYPASEIIGKSWFTNFLPARMKKDVRTIFKKIISGQIKKVEYYQNPIITKNGKERLISFHNADIKDENGKIIGTLSSGEDITEREKKEKLKKEILESISDGFFALDQNFEITYFNERAEEILKKKRKSVIGKNIFDSLPEIKGSIFEKKFKEALKNKKLVAFEIFFARKPYINWYDVRIFPQDNGISVYFRITTKEKKQEEELKRIISNLREAEKIGHFGSFTWNLAKKEITYSKEMGRIFGWSPTEKTISEKKFLSCIHEEDKPLLMKCLNKVTTIKNYQGAVTYRIILPNKSEKTLHCRSRAKWQSNKAIFLRGTTYDITEQKKYEEELRAKEKRLAILFDNAPDAMYMVDLKGNFVDANKMAEKVTSYSKKEMMGQNLFRTSLLGPGDLAKAARSLSRNLRGLPSEYEDYTLTQRDGKKIDVEIKSYPIKINDKRYLLGIARDITEKKKAEEALRQSEERFRQVTASANEWVWEVDEKGLYTYSNPIVKKILGYAPEEIVGKKYFFDFFHPDDKNKLKKLALSKFSKKEKFHDLVNHNIDKYGDTVWFSTSGFPVIGKNGALLGYRCTDTDITEQKKYEQALKISESKYRKLFENMLDGFALHKIVLDKNGQPVDYTFLEINKAFEKLTGLKAKDIIGKNVTEVMPGIKKDPVNWVKKYGQVAKTGKEVRFEDYSESLKKWYSVLAFSPEKNYFAAIFEDITERKESEKILSDMAKFPEENPNPVLRIDKTCKLRYANNAARKTFRIKGNEIGGKFLTQIKGKKFCRMQNSHSEELEIYGKIFSLIFEPIKEKEYTNIYGYDITAAKQAQETVRQSEEKYRSVVEKSRQGIVIAQGVPPKLKFTNSMMQEITGYSQNELANLSDKKTIGLIAPEFRQKFFENYQERLSGKLTSSRYEIKLIRKDKAERWVEIYSTRIMFENEPAVQAAFIDVTNRKTAEEKLKEEKANFQAIVEDQTEYICQFDRNGQITFSNQAFAVFHARSTTEMLKENITDDVVEEDKPRLKKLIKSLGSHHSVGGLEFRVKAPNGETRWQAWTFRSIFEDHEKFATFQAVGRDITQFKWAQDSLKEHAIELEAMNRIMDVGAKAHDMDTLLKESLEATMSMLGFNSGSIYLIDEETKTAKISYQSGLTPEFIAATDNININEKPYRQVLVEGKPLLTNTYQENYKDHAKIIPFKTMASIPLLSKEKIIGAVNIASEKSVKLDEDKKNNLKSIGAEIGSIIDRLQIEEQIREKNLELERFNRSMVGRELKMIELKDKIKQLESKLANKG